MGEPDDEQQYVLLSAEGVTLYVQRSLWESLSPRATVMWVSFAGGREVAVEWGGGPRPAP